MLLPNNNTQLKLKFFEEVLSLLRQGISLHIQHKTMSVLHLIWLFAYFLWSFHEGQMNVWLSLNKPCGKGRD